MQIGFSFAVWTLLGPMSFVYLLTAWYFSAGPHPVAIRLLQEHEILRKNQQTNSYYVPFNLLVFNLGYHKEHHDLPSVSWLRLPALYRMAPEFYDRLAKSGSWLGTFFGFLFDEKRSLWDRTYRERGPVAAPPLPASTHPLRGRGELREAGSTLGSAVQPGGAASLRHTPSPPGSPRC